MLSFSFKLCLFGIKHVYARLRGLREAWDELHVLRVDTSVPAATGREVSRSRTAWNKGNSSWMEPCFGVCVECLFLRTPGHGVS